MANRPLDMRERQAKAWIKAAFAAGGEVLVNPKDGTVRIVPADPSKERDRVDEMEEVRL